MDQTRSAPNWPLHEISVGNLVLGRAWFVSVPLDSIWEWRRGPSLPEVDATLRRAGRNCVASGRAWYALHHGEHPYGCELSLDIRPGTADPSAGWERWTRGMEQGMGTINGHRALVARGQTRRGLVRPITLSLVRAQVLCDLTERTVRIEFVGNLPRDVLDEIQASLPLLRCH